MKFKPLLAYVAALVLNPQGETRKPRTDFERLLKMEGGNYDQPRSD